MSQVKNLRAMFENKGDTSPPHDRGRPLGVSTPSPTPAGKERFFPLQQQQPPPPPPPASIQPASLLQAPSPARAFVPALLLCCLAALLLRSPPTLLRRFFLAAQQQPATHHLPFTCLDASAACYLPVTHPKMLTQPSPTGPNGSPRPLSKIRTNFIAIERDGQVGLRIDHIDRSTDSSVSGRRLSCDTDTGSATTIDRAMAASIEDVTNTLRKLSVNDDVPLESPQPAAALSDRPGTNPDKTVDEETPTASLTPADPTTKPLSGEPGNSANGAPRFDKPAAAAADKGKAPSPKTPPKVPAKPASMRASPEAPRTADTSPTTNPVPVPKEAKAPAVNEGVPVINEGVPVIKEEPPVIKEESPVIKEESPVIKEEAPATTATTATTSAAPKRRSRISAIARPQPIKTGDNGASAVKPKIKSPTRPANLRSSLTAPTVSSVSRLSASRQSASRQSLSRQSVNPIHSTVTASTAASAAKTAKRTSIGRPSLGPPPSKSSQEPPKKPKEVDETFLARMTRPTQASSNKTTEKVPVTPPRKSARSSTGGTERGTRASTRSPSSKASRIPAPKDSAAKSTRKASNPAKEADKVQSVEAKGVTSKTAKVDKAAVANLAHKTSSDEKPVRPNDAKSEPVLEEAAPKTANVAIAQEADSVPTSAKAECSASETTKAELVINTTQEPNPGDSLAVSEASPAGAHRAEPKNQEKTTGDLTETPESTLAQPPEILGSAGKDSKEETKPNDPSTNGHVATDEPGHPEAEATAETTL